ncbi:hypothetical protein ACIA8K_22155 [Catenuloplanes sp. NPDC051500]|uniref:hypothetical protein n=1 Tax=Catenuloplanes sp. NPDC051500 TaxID=3363959 RepID=UPI0037B81DDA
MTKLSMRTLAAACVLAMAATGLTAAPAAAAPAEPLGTLTSTVTGTFTDATGGIGTFTGTFTPSQFTEDGETISATGLVDGELIDSAGTSLGTTSAPATTQVTQLLPGASCEVLDLRLAPLNLDLLGLVVHLDYLHLNITAVPGAGNLLGNLLCAVVGLLDPLGPLSGIVALLNQILAALGLAL